MMHPDESRTVTWGQYGGLKAAGLAERDLTICALYKSKPRLRITNSKHKSVSVISIKSFEGTDASDHNYDRDTAKALGELVQIVRGVFVSGGAINVRQVEDDTQN